MANLSANPALLAQLRARRPLLWLNRAAPGPLPPAAPSPDAIALAEARLARCEPLAAALFPELVETRGRIEAPLVCAAQLQTRGKDAKMGVQAAADASPARGAWFLKCDHMLPVAGSIKARGGFHEVFAYAEAVAREHGLIGSDRDDYRMLAAPAARAVFARHTIAVGSTGNLGLAVGSLAVALGFETIVHMSVDAKPWKKARLSQRGVKVVEHAGDYARAVAAGRAQALAMPRCHFVDDERSLALFLGYAAAARHLGRQLADHGRRVDAAHPLFIYLPCGVGGAPGGITYGVNALFGEHVHCFFAEPTAAPSMLVQLALGGGQPLSVYDIGLDNRTDADGLAVGQASELVSPLMAAQLCGVFTVDDAQLYAHLLAVKEALDMDLEPSAAAGVAGPAWLLDTPAGRDYARRRNLDMQQATHVIWTTGGSLVPAAEHRRFQAHARALRAASGA